MENKLFQRSSKKRDIILEELRKVTTHPTAAILYKAVRKRIPNISIGTIYRNLNQMAKKGIIQKLEVGGNEACFDGDINKHYHISCTMCGKVDDVCEISYKNKKTEMAKIINGYQVSGYHMNYFGICSDCLHKIQNESNI